MASAAARPQQQQQQKQPTSLEKIIRRPAHGVPVLKMKQPERGSTEAALDVFVVVEGALASMICVGCEAAQEGLDSLCGGRSAGRIIQ
jgi:hypothetical protein